MTAQLETCQVRIVAPNDVHASLDSKIYVKMNYDNALYFNRSTEQFITRHNKEEILSAHMRKA